MMIWDGYGWGWGGWLLMTFIMIVLWALIAGAVVALLRGFRGGGLVADPRRRPTDERPTEPQPTDKPPADERSAERILAERYARGEIEDDEYRRRLDVIRGAHGTTDLTNTG